MCVSVVDDDENLRARRGYNCVLEPSTGVVVRLTILALTKSKMVDGRVARVRSISSKWMGTSQLQMTQVSRTAYGSWTSYCNRWCVGSSGHFNHICTRTPNLSASPIFSWGNSRNSLETHQPPFPAHTHYMLFLICTYLNAHACKYFRRKGLLVSSCRCKNGNTLGIGCQAQSATTAAYHTS